MKKLLVVLFVSILLTVTVRATSTTMTVDIPAQNVLVGNQYYVMSLKNCLILKWHNLRKKKNLAQ